ncbi:hypothetical protein Smic_42930 [Streptomyces microflavus]|uniref:Uncharacterized protein n=1 Tax=Streptomyces microflavus TaxID=1919 RepID=A0A7J0CVG0_STRMI|nr:hypothetical protein Smic_42930 [Streptomyces microflavus]
MDLHGEADTARVQSGDQPHRTGDRRPAEAPALPRERLPEARVRTVGIALDVDLAVADMHFTYDWSAHGTPCTRVEDGLDGSGRADRVGPIMLHTTDNEPGPAPSPAWAQVP